MRNFISYRFRAQHLAPLLATNLLRWRFHVCILNAVKPGKSLFARSCFPFCACRDVVVVVLGSATACRKGAYMEKKMEKSLKYFSSFIVVNFLAFPSWLQIQMNRARLLENCHGFCITLGAWLCGSASQPAMDSVRVDDDVVAIGDGLSRKPLIELFYLAPSIRHSTNGCQRRSIQIFSCCMHSIYVLHQKSCEGAHLLSGSETGAINRANSPQTKSTVSRKASLLGYPIPGRRYLTNVYIKSKPLTASSHMIPLSRNNQFSQSNKLSLGGVWRVCDWLLE